MLAALPHPPTLHLTARARRPHIFSKGGGWARTAGVAAKGKRAALLFHAARREWRRALAALGRARAGGHQVGDQSLDLGPWEWRRGGRMRAHVHVLARAYA
eukprot:7388514-Prymnesium_polylepis.3